MGFLNQLLKYKNICIQCHNSPDADALAAAYGVYTYLKLHDINVSIIYSGDYEIQKKDLLYMIDICEIPVAYVKSYQRQIFYCWLMGNMEEEMYIVLKRII